MAVMGPSPELGEQRPSQYLPPVRFYRTGKEAVPRDAAVIRLHPPLYAGDFDNPKLRNAYYWEQLEPNHKEEQKLRLALHYGEERSPRCENCEKEDRACMSGLGRRYQNTGCALCTRRHLHCSQANGARKKTNAPVRPTTDPPVRKNIDPPVRENTDSPMSTAILDDEFHTPMESRSRSVYSITSLRGSDTSLGDSHKTDIGIVVDDSHAEYDLPLRNEGQNDADGWHDVESPPVDVHRDERLTSFTPYLPSGSCTSTKPQNAGPNSTQSQEVVIQQNSNGGTSIFEELSKYFSALNSKHDKLVRELRSANARLTRRVDQLENPQTNSWQNLEARLVALEKMPTPQQHGQESCTTATATRMLEARLLKLEKANAGLSDDGGMGDGLKRLEGLTERERAERRAQAGRIENRVTNLRDEQAVLQNEHLGLNTRLNDLAKKMHQNQG
ncbi:hypothetical protein D6D19_01502 [Aureobasidium pullulans]|uniref:Zn(2)-C6 fungal-type domain-containing protein n=1 Tax=Aureobasidium pullulans TaxID=5580 RepID=A0A4S9L2A6_AURPU|nr:hypothetical protein D6D19_01502 [Aureobasidium pullulans]THY22440.1 hypothetical protein D6D00_06867 [Aureobasidium pullulans]